MIRFIIFIFIVSGLVAFAVLYRPPNQYAVGYTDGYNRASVDIKIFVSGTGRLPNSDWSNRAAQYRLNKKETPSEGIALGLMPDPQTTLQPFALSSNQ